jgi:hypothetical protein
MFSLNLIDDGVRDLLDPRTRALVELHRLRGRRAGCALARAASNITGETLTTTPFDGLDPIRQRGDNA